jgi:hypothetical protein
MTNSATDTNTSSKRTLSENDTINEKERKKSRPFGEIDVFLQISFFKAFF